MHGTLDRSLPIGIERFALVGAHLWLKGAVDSPLLSYFIRAAPEANRYTCEVGCPERCCLRNLWSLYWHTENVGLELHEEVVYNGTTIDTERLQVYFAV